MSSSLAYHVDVGADPAGRGLPAAVELRLGQVQDRAVEGVVVPAAAVRRATLDALHDAGHPNYVIHNRSLPTDRHFMRVAWTFAEFLYDRGRNHPTA